MKAIYMFWGILLGAVLGSTVVTVAADDVRQANKIYMAGDQTVYVFDDAGNKCYVVSSARDGRSAGGISCIAGGRR